MSLVDALRSNSPSITCCRVSLANERNVKNFGQAIQHNTQVEELILSCPAIFAGDPWSSSNALVQFLTRSVTLTNITLESWGGRVVNDDGSSSVYVSTFSSPSSFPLSFDRSFEGCLLRAVIANDKKNENIRKLALRFHDRRRLIDGPTLANMITGTKTLSHLYIDAKIHRDDARMIASSLAKNSTIEELRLDCTGVSEAMSYIIRSLHLSTSLTTLHLEHVDNTVALAVRDCLSAVTSFPVSRLRNLVLDGTDTNDIQPEMRDACKSMALHEILIGLLNGCRSIEFLTLKRFKMTTSSAAMLRTLMSSETGKLKELSLLCCSFAGLSFHEVLEGMGRNKTIVKFVVQRPVQTSAGVGMRLQRMIETNVGLEALSLRGDFGSSVAACIAKGLGLSSHPRLHRLDLQDGVGDKGFDELLDVMGGCGRPFELELGRQGAHALAATLKARRPCPMLSHLNLEGCRLPAEDVDLLLAGLEKEALGQQPFLKKLNLTGNVMNDDAAHRMSGLIGSAFRHTLQVLWLRHCRLSASGVVRILRSLKGNAVLVELCLDVENEEDTSSGEAVWQCLATILPSVRKLRRLVMVPSGDVGWGYVDGLEKTMDEVVGGFQANASLTSVLLFCTLAPASLLLTLEKKIAHYCLRNKYFHLAYGCVEGDDSGAPKYSSLLPLILSSCHDETKNRSHDGGPSVAFLLMKGVVTDHCLSN